MADEQQDYKVGPGRPPLHTRFPEGAVRNPGGRSKKKLNALLTYALNERILLRSMETSLSPRHRSAYRLRSRGLVCLLADSSQNGSRLKAAAACKRVDQTLGIQYVSMRSR